MKENYRDNQSRLKNKIFQWRGKTSQAVLDLRDHKQDTDHPGMIWITVERSGKVPGDINYMRQEVVPSDLRPAIRPDNT